MISFHRCITSFLCSFINFFDNIHACQQSDLDFQACSTGFWCPSLFLTKFSIILDRYVETISSEFIFWTTIISEDHWNAIYIHELLHKFEEQMLRKILMNDQSKHTFARISFKDIFFRIDLLQQYFPRNIYLVLIPLRPCADWTVIFIIVSRLILLFLK